VALNREGAGGCSQRWVPSKACLLPTAKQSVTTEGRDSAQLPLSFSGN